MDLNIIQFILNMVGLIIILFITHKKYHPNKNKICESCIFLECKDTTRIDCYHCINVNRKKEHPYDTTFSKCPKICCYYESKYENTKEISNE